MTRALVAAGADVLSIAESRHTLEDVYLELIEDKEGRTAMSMSATRIGAVIRKELAEFRRNRFIVVTAGVLPIIFLISPPSSILRDQGDREQRRAGQADRRGAVPAAAGPGLRARGAEPRTRWSASASREPSSRC